MENLGIVLKWIGSNWVMVLAFLSIFIEIVPVKIYPWSAVIKWIGDLINKPVMEELKKLRDNELQALKVKVDTVEADLKDTKREQQENEKDRIRWEILDFANSCRNGRNHTKDEFEHVFRMNDKYENLLMPNEKNSYFEAEYKYIQGIYADRQEKNDFL